MKEYAIYLAIKKCKSKLHEDFSSSHLECLWSRPRTTVNVGEDVVK
jgi:hypothetical protein